jgi:hypothetical protein
VRSLWRVGLCALILLTAGCGQVEVGEGAPGQSLCFDYYQRCVNGNFDTAITYVSTNTCSASGCHQNPGSAGDSFKITPGATIVSPVDLLNALGSDMYGNFLSAKGSVDFNNAAKSDLLRKPLGIVLHGGGIIFDSTFSEYRQLEYWATNRVDNPFAACGDLFVGLSSDQYSTSSVQCPAL